MESCGSMFLFDFGGKEKIKTKKNNITGEKCREKNRIDKLHTNCA